MIIRLYYTMKTLFKTVLRYVTHNNTTTVEPPNNGQIGSTTFVLYREVVPFWRLRLICSNTVYYTHSNMQNMQYMVKNRIRIQAMSAH